MLISFSLTKYGLVAIDWKYNIYIIKIITNGIKFDMPSYHHV